MPSNRLSPKDFIQLAEKVPARPDVVTLHDYVASVRQLINGQDVIRIPESHQHLLIGQGNHEGSGRLNARVRQMSAWLSQADMRFSVASPGQSDKSTAGASTQERFARRGEKEFARGTGLHRWKQEVNRDIAEVGVGIFMQVPRKDYYIQAAKNPSMMAEGSKLTDVLYRQRIDPASFGWVEASDGSIGKLVISQTRMLGELAREIGVEASERVLGFFDFGTSLDPENPDAWDARFVVETAEVWGPDNAALLITGGSNTTRSFGNSTQGRILWEADNPFGHPPVYVAAPGVWPWHSPLDEMIQLTNERNYWATMLDVQASGAIFTNWQLINTETGEDITSQLPPDAVPQHMIYDPSKPPPYMGAGKEWRLAPFEFHDVLPRYEMIAAQHEAAGSSIARLMGQNVRADSAVGTVDFSEEAAQREVSEFVEAKELATEEAWRDAFFYIRTRHKDPVVVADRRRDPESGFSFVSTDLPLSAEEIVTDDITATLDTRSRLAKLADARYATEQIINGFMDYNRAVELGLLWGIDDPELEKLALFVAAGEKIEADVELLSLHQEALKNAGLLPEQGGNPEPRFLSGNRTDPRGTGTQQGGDNISNTGISEGASDVTRTG